MELKDQDLRYWLALCRAPGIGPATFHQLLDHFGTPAALFTSAPALAHLLPPEALPYMRQPDWRLIEEDLRWAEQDDCHIITCADLRYPALLHQTHAPPPVLYVLGQVQCLQAPQLAMVGSRNPTPGGLQTAHDFAADLARSGLVITSGLALGIDAASHQGALDGGGMTIAVAGTGLDRVYPARHRDLAHRIAQRGALVSEYPLGTRPMPHQFPQRNRIISGLSLGTLVIEAGLASGSLITARQATDQGRDVFAVPGSIHNPLSRGCHQLIREGAKLVETVEDILEELPAAARGAPCRQGVPAAGNPVTGLDQASLDLLQLIAFDPIAIDELVSRSGLTAETISSILLALELENLVATSAGRYYRLPDKAPK